MKPSFHCRVPNGPFDDPMLYVRLLREKRAIMFDMGSAPSLSNREILKLSDIFVSHTHIDHFIGFDHFLRISLRKETPVRIYGPEGIITAVEGKLRGYSWNLADGYPLGMSVTELTPKGVKKAFFRAANFFRTEYIETEPFNNILLSNDSCKVTAAIIDHQIPCLAFSMEEDYHININKDLLNKRGLPVGPWLGDFKKAIRAEEDDRVFKIDERSYRTEELKDLATITKGQKISYVVDAQGSEENIRIITDLVRGSDTLYIETYFSDKDRALARERFHLTAKDAGVIAGNAGVKKIVPIHFSPRYMDEPERLIIELNDKSYE